MAQLVTRIDDSLAEQVDTLVEQGLVESRSDAVRQGLTALVDHHRRRQIAAAIVAGYQAQPQTDDELVFDEASAVRMIAEEPW